MSQKSFLLICCVGMLFTGCFSSEMTSHNSVSRTKVPEFVHSETQIHENCVSLKMSKAVPFNAIKAEEGTELYHVYFDYVQFEGNTESIQKLNKIIRDLVFDGQPSSADYLKNFLFENKNMLKHTDPTKHIKYEDVEKITLVLNTDKIISFTHDDYGWKEGGTEGYGTVEVFNFDLKKGELIKSEDLIDPAKYALLEDVLEKSYRFTLAESDSQIPLKKLGWAKNHVNVAENIGIEQNGLNFMYHKQEEHLNHETLSIFVPYEKIDELLKEGTPLAMNLVGE